MKKLKFILSLLLIFVFVSTPVLANGNTTMYINNKEEKIREVPIVIDGKKVYSEKSRPTFIWGNDTYVPIRFIAERYGAEVTWNPKTKAATIVNGKDTIVMTINKKEVLVNGKTKVIAGKPTPILARPVGERNASTMVPLRFISETLGHEVGYDSKNKCPIINTKVLPEETPSETKPGASDSDKPSKPSNTKGVDISLVRGSTGGAKLNIRSNNLVSYSHTMTGNRIKLTINNAGLNNKNMENVKLTGKGMSSVIAREVGSNVEIDIILEGFTSIDISSFNAGKEITLSPVSQVKSISKELVNGKNAVVIYKENTTKVNRMTLNNPKRFVFDIMDSVLGHGYKEFNISFGSISNVRASQYSPDKTYNPKDKITRVVVDMNSNEGNLDVKEYKDKIVITEGAKVVEKPTPPKPTEPTKPTKPSKPKPNNGKTIVIDAGHGGHDSGAVSGGTKEKDIALSVAKKVDGILRGKGFNVIMTRNDDTYVSLNGRSKIANDANADLFVSIHANSFSGASANGIETLHSGSTASKKLSQGIQDELIKETGATDRGIKHRPNLAVLRGTKMPATLVELGFITNPNELAKLKSDSYQNKLARAIANGIEKYFK